MVDANGAGYASRFLSLTSARFNIAKAHGIVKMRAFVKNLVASTGFELLPLPLPGIHG